MHQPAHVHALVSMGASDVPQIEAYVKGQPLHPLAEVGHQTAHVDEWTEPAEARRLGVAGALGPRTAPGQQALRAGRCRGLGTMSLCLWRLQSCDSASATWFVDHKTDEKHPADSQGSRHLPLPGKRHRGPL